jgi:hypothetical protein
MHWRSDSPAPGAQKSSSDSGASAAAGGASRRRTGSTSTSMVSVSACARDSLAPPGKKDAPSSTSGV